jgi:hypothetical protein
MKILDRMKDLLEAKTDIELSEKLGMSLRTVGTWRSREAVPDKVIRGWSIKYGKPVEWFTGEESKKPELDPRDQENFDLIMKLDSRGKRALKARLYEILAEQERASLEQDE